MSLQISHGKYTLFSANFFVGLRACIETAKLIDFIVYLFGKYTISPSIFAKNRNFS